MKFARSIIFVVCLVTSTLRVTAQDRMGSTPGPIARAIAREAVRLTVDPGAGSVEGEWSRVRTLAPGTDIILTVQRSQPGERWVVRADEFGLTVLNVAIEPLPADVQEVLRGVAANHPEYFSAAQRGATFVLEKRVRLARDGVHVGNQKVADIGQIVISLARHDVVEIKTRERGRGAWGQMGPLGGYFVGAMSGGLVVGFACRATAERDRCDSGAFGIGALIGGIVGGVHGFRAASRETEEIIYRAPETQASTCGPASKASSMTGTVC
jgi:hypothetical protein